MSDAPATRADPHAPIRVLAVDDDPEMASLIADSLEHADERMTVTTAHSPADGHEVLDTAHVDCIVSDYDMPDATGIDFLLEVRDVYPDLPFILFTGMGSEEVAGEAISAGVTDYLQKGTDASQFAVLANRIANTVEQLRSKRQLQANHEWYRTLLAHSSDFLMVVDADGEITYVSPAVTTAMGYDPDDLIGEDLLSFCHPDDRERTRRALETLRTSSDQSIVIQQRTAHADGSWRWVEVNGRNHLDDPLIEGLLVNVRDITDRKDRERAIEELHTAARELYETQTRDGAAELIIEQLVDLLGMPTSVVWLYDAGSNALRPMAWSDRGGEPAVEPPTIEPGATRAWSVFESGAPARHGDASTVRSQTAADTTIGGELLLPIGTHGVIGIGFAESDSLDDVDVSLAETVAAHAATALDRIDRAHDREETTAFLSSLFEALPVGVLAEDTSGTVLAANRRLFELFDLEGEPRELLGNDVGAVTRALSGEVADSARFRERIARRIARRAPTDAEHIRLADGRTFARSYRSISFPEGSGHLWVYLDVSELEHLRNRYEQILRVSTDAFFEWDPAADRIIRHGEYFTQLGYDPATVGEGIEWWRDRIHPADRERVDAAAHRALVEPSFTYDETYRFEREDGTYGYLRSRGVVEYDDDGTPRRMIGAHVDITERKRYEERLEQLQRRTQSLMHTPGVEGTAELAVRAANEDLGAPLAGLHIHDELDGRLEPVAFVDELGIFDATPEYRRDVDDGRLDVNRYVWRVFEDGKPVYLADVREEPSIADDTPIESAFLFPLGEHGIFIVSDTEPNAFDDADRALLEILATSITEALDRACREERLRDREQALARQNDRLEEFASILSHDLRNPVNVALGRLELVRAETESEHLEQIEAALKRMEGFIDDLLAFAKFGEAATELEPVALANEVADCWELIETAAAELHVDTELRVQADRGRLRQLLENLFRNAIDHGGPEVTITVGELSDEPGFYIADTGPGIPPDQREHVFQSGVSTDDDGTGLGLAIVKQVANAHGWTISVAADNDDGGARFEITGVDVAP